MMEEDKSIDCVKKRLVEFFPRYPAGALNGPGSLSSHLGSSDLIQTMKCLRYS
jgi:hypothetical protein